MRRPATVCAIVLVLALGAVTAGCGGDDSSSSNGSGGLGKTVDVNAVDYEFNLPATVAAGTTLRLQNRSTDEVHEMVAFKLPAGEQRSAKDLLALSDEALSTLFSGTQPAGVLVALPGKAGQTVVGSGKLTAKGRYLLFCAIPKGAPAQPYADALKDHSATAPDVQGGAPHFTLGMSADLTVQ